MGQFEQLLATFGPFGVFIGAAFEGQAAVIAGGFLAHLKIMSIWTVIAAAAAGSGLIDHGLFLAGRRFRAHPFVVRMVQTPAFAKSLVFVERYPFSSVFTVRFIFGLRLAGPVAIGVSQMSTAQFTIVNALSAVIWAAMFAAMGYWFGETIETWFGHLKGLEQAMGVGLVVLVVAFAAYHLVKWLWTLRKNRAGG